MSSYGRRNRRNTGGDSLGAFLMILFIAIYAFPFVGGYLILSGLASKNGDKAILGTIILIIGFIILFIIAAH